VLNTFRPALDLIDEFVPLSFEVGQSARPSFGIHGRLLARDGLFARVSDFVAKTVHENLGFPIAEERMLPIAAFSLSRSLAVTVDRRSVKPSLIQCFLVAMAKRFPNGHEALGGAPLVPTVIDADAELTLWSMDPNIDHAACAALWREISTGGALDELEVQTTPKLYGSKERLTDLLFGVAVASLPTSAPILAEGAIQAWG